MKHAFLPSEMFCVCTTCLLGFGAKWLWGFLSVCINMTPYVLSFSTHVLGGSVNEPLEPGGDGEEGS